ncbi:MAG: hypothetical protein ACKVVP_25445 [Chloroflexota bacterium]
MIQRRLFSLLLCVGMLLAAGAHGATAADEPDAPTLVSVEVESSTELQVKWDDVGEAVLRLTIRIYGPGATDVPTIAIPLIGMDGGFVPTSGEYSVRQLDPNTKYCVAPDAFVGATQSKGVFSEESARRCVSTPGLPAAAPDLVVREIRGKEDLDWDVVNQRNPVYILMLENDGVDATGTVVVEIQTSGVVTLADQIPILQQGWASQGFSCARMPASGGANASLLCTGGSLKEGQSFNPGVLTRVTGRGFGYVHVAINVTRGRGDSHPDDKRLTLAVQAT